MKEHLAQHLVYLNGFKSKLTEAQREYTELVTEMTHGSINNETICRIVNAYIAELGQDIEDLKQRIEREEQWRAIFE